MAKRTNYTAQEVIALCLTYMNSDHVKFVNKAYEYARDAHDGQMRKSGEEYIVHPIQVAGILAEIHMDPVTVAAGFLHDVVEDTDNTYEDIKKEFTEEVADLVDGVSKLGKFKFTSKREHQAENHRKMLLAMAQDVRVILVKLADRLHNMRTLKFHRAEKQVEIANETLDIYAPLADRLGMIRIKWELEDLSLRYTNPQQFYRIVHLMDSRREDREQYIADSIHAINEAINELEIEAEITGRPKHIYSIYKKMKTQKKQFDEIYDLLAIRVLVDSIKDCYAVLGAIHTQWKPMPGRFKDYIAMPKANMYQSLHTTVLGPNATPLEVQIRTHQMHEVAEYGVAAHWAYKEGVTTKVQNDELGNQLSWFRDIIELQSESSDASEFMDAIKQDFFTDNVYVFTPNGDVMELPDGASTLDFAYHVHSEVGDHSTGARVNGKIVPINYKLKTGDIVEIITSPSSAGPSRDWLNFVSTSKAKNKIRRYFKVQEEDEAIENGERILIELIEEQEFDPAEFMIDAQLDQLANEYNFKDKEKLFAAIGFNEVKALTVVNRLTEDARKRRNKDSATLEKTLAQKVEKKPEKEKIKIHHEDGVVVEDTENLLLRLSKCCNPVPGDDIVGYITRGRGISVHRRDCPNVIGEEDLTNRLIEVEWENKSTGKIYDTDLEVYGFDRSGLLNDILEVINSLSNRLSNINGRVDNNQMATIQFSIGIRNTEELEQIMDKINQIPDVYSIKRIIL
ncbi:MAG TPA: bifunctional (p)ppGpp synthetase/guanosine-3',5'-bis(diphosphate) 3'-pyrophosphohydrolase [Atopostipes sp.]|nr:bifunctional (p)ppGpp synthetase/guanosine-3',5'-bis(diphosphate) 3'-pyrophosphohydrolase [Atopostipes sp.]